MVVIKVRRNGPYLVDASDAVKLIDWNGQEYAVPGRPFVLCRCGGSSTKPFCDRTHRATGFRAEEAAGPGRAGEPPGGQAPRS